MEELGINPSSFFLHFLTWNKLEMEKDSKEIISCKFMSKNFFKNGVDKCGKMCYNWSGRARPFNPGKLPICDFFVDSVALPLHHIFPEIRPQAQGPERATQIERKYLTNAKKYDIIFKKRLFSDRNTTEPQNFSLILMFLGLITPKIFDFFKIL